MNPKDALNIKDFFDAEGKLKLSLINNDVPGGLTAVLEAFNQPTFPSERGPRPLNNKKLNINQLRKFYDTFLRIYNSNRSIDEKKIQLLMLKANSEYSANRLGTYAFNYFFQQRINLVLSKNGDDFNKYLDALKLHLEALVGYFPKN